MPNLNGTFLRSLLSGTTASPTANRRRARLVLEELEDRAVPSATPLDLTTAGTSGQINGAIFRQSSPQPTGTGVINSFVRLQATGSQAVEQGYNTDARPLQFNENNSPQFTRSLPLSSVPLVNIDGVNYREFLLDINQKASKPLLSLDELRIFAGNAPNLKGYDATSQTLAGLTATYNLDAGQDNYVKLDARLSNGSGSGDMILDVPDSAFGGGQYVYLYSKFGVNFAASSGFEEWATRKVAAVAPTPATASLSGFVTDTDDDPITMPNGIAGVLITLTGTTASGQSITLTTYTLLDGSYSFTNLQAGTYTLTETVGENYVPDSDSVGTVNGLVDGTAIDLITLDSIVLTTGDSGIDYNFVQLYSPNT